MSEKPKLPVQPFLANLSADPPEGVHPDLAFHLLCTGWSVYPGVSVLSPSGLMVVGSDKPRLVAIKADLWIPPLQTLFADSDLVQCLMWVETQGGDILTLDGLCKRMLGIPYATAKQLMQDIIKKNEEQHGSDGGDLAAKAGGPNVISPDFSKRSGSKKGVD